MQHSLFEFSQFVVMDGGMGTMLQARIKAGQRPELAALSQPDALREIHAAYVDAGAKVLCANTFGANPGKLADTGASVEEVVAASVACAKQAAAGRALAALDVGPLGELLEPVGSLSFKSAYAYFARVMRAGQAAGAELVLIETLADLYEAKAAVLAARECTSLPVLVSMTFEKDGRSFHGVPVEAFAAAIGSLGPLALGINCSLGPAEIMPLLQRLRAATPLPVFAKPNAGLPDPESGAYHLSPESFCRAMAPCLENGVSMVGGCCGTTPDTIACLSKTFAGRSPARKTHHPQPLVCGATHVTVIDRPRAIGERINPTGKKLLRQALQNGDVAMVQTLAAQQQAAGADILDVNVGAPGVDEVTLLPLAVKAVQAVCGLPLMLDSANPEALAAALRVCCGKPVVNSTSGEPEKMDKILPLCAKYGAAVVGLTMDGDGIPETAAKRAGIAERILLAAEGHGLPRQDVWIDCLTLTAGAQQDAGAVTLQAVQRVKRQLQLVTVLGVSNISFGLPDRPRVNRCFLAMALAAGLDLPILNPDDAEMMATLDAAALLLGAPGGTDAYLARAAGQQAALPAALGGGQGLPLGEAIRQGLKAQAAGAMTALLGAQPADALALAENELIPALDAVGREFEAGRMFLPQMLASAGAAQAAFDVLRAHLQAGSASTGPPVVVATVEGDIHDIGKNIAKILLENYGFTVIDLGRDVPPARVVEAAQKSGAGLVGLSALMTTTLPAMERTIKALRAAGLPCRVLVGGAVLTGDYARKIGADFYAKDAMASADYARRLHGKEGTR